MDPSAAPAARARTVLARTQPAAGSLIALVTVVVGSTSGGALDAPCWDAGGHGPVHARPRAGGPRGVHRGGPPAGP
jgi:hypothetical protein